jgi:hypothetical protein
MVRRRRGQGTLAYGRHCSTKGSNIAPLRVRQHARPSPPAKAAEMAKSPGGPGANGTLIRVLARAEDGVGHGVDLHVEEAP